MSPPNPRLQRTRFAKLRAPLSRTARTIAAFVLAPLMTPLIFVASTRITSKLPGPDEIWMYLFYFGLLTYPSVIVLGIPAFLLYRRYGLRSVGAYAIGGVAIGLATAAVWLLPFMLWPSRAGFPMSTVATCVVAGAASALLFREIADAGT